ncbi:hypothetical protein [Sessilibacter corallicola]|uniref:Uncharacterized protein n=1 Tax=Sessilibacter corallicola TaxID=2904075 RepID=A0ABQ0A748_9GAMM|nr:hypothetical protein [Sessilibacter corallicola]MCE2028431.1 hypothetical protein [Sessilibacter corallicola]
MNFYAKTLKGINEMRSRSGEVNPTARRMLILCNGQTSTDQIIGAAGKADAKKYLKWLLEENYITNGDESKQSRDYNQDLVMLPSHRSAAEFDKAKNFMINTIGHFHGQYGYLSLKTEIANVKDCFELRGFYAEWAESMESFKQFDKLKSDLFKFL